MLAACNEVAADKPECVVLPEGDTMSFTLTSDSGFNNCFSLQVLKPNTQIRFFLTMPDNVQNKVEPFDSSAPGTATAVAEYVSNVEGANGFMINTENRELLLRITPLTHAGTDKALTASMILINGVAQILFLMEDIAASNSNDLSGDQ